MTVEREAHTDHMVRRGLALIVNHGFAATPGGQKDFMYKVTTIAGAVQATKTLSQRSPRPRRRPATRPE